MRIGGLASGIDTDSIIRDMMQANRIPLNKITQKKQYLEWQVDSYRAVNRQMNSFSTMIFDSLMNPTTSIFRKKAIEVSDEKAVSMKAVGSSQEMSGTLQIHQLAQNASLQGKEIVLKEQNGKLNVTESLKDQIGDSVVGSFKITAPGGTEETITVDDTTTMQDLLKQLNGAGVNAFYDSKTGKIAMTAKNSGEDKIEITADPNNPSDIVAKLGLNVTGEEGKDAIFTYNGLQTSRNSNTFELNGFEFTLKEVTAPLKADQEGKPLGQKEVEAGGRTITFTSKADTEHIIDGIKNFVDEYNKMIEDLNGQIREQKYRSYHPLSAEEKSEMKEKEIELWEEKAKSGTLRNDPTVSNMLSSMRLALSNPFGGKGGDTLSSIGITTSKDYMSNGKLEIDEDALRKALQEDPAKVEQMFTGGRTEKEQENQGFAVRLRGIADNTRKTLTDKAGTAGFANETFTLGRNLKEMDNQILRFQERLQKTEDRLWREFTAMEQAMNRANAQAAQLMNGLGGMM